MDETRIFLGGSVERDQGTHAREIQGASNIFRSVVSLENPWMCHPNVVESANVEGRSGRVAEGQGTLDEI